MAKQKLILITGRSTRQGAGISNGKELPEYKEATGVIDLNQMDMQRSGLNNGDPVRLTTDFGNAEATCRLADIPEGLAFISFGPVCNRLIGSETYASGMPDLKHIQIEIAGIAKDESRET